MNQGEQQVASLMMLQFEMMLGVILKRKYCIVCGRGLLEIIGRAVREMISLSIPVPQGGYFHDVIFCMMLAYIKGPRILCVDADSLWIEVKWICSRFDHVITCAHHVATRT
ncbi:hypothetical protein AVEN_144685-1 [Araneus ventricosus]|uniref:Uncharacterized protein n=1 Tax=Araneus ventricosus TaxID=182803 RepID=A0A4Y2I6Q3_ARAVE|nr:hypothetical protein AVEN_144685-1 [Araneus ventricosus]